MNNTEAKFVLDAYRPNGGDAIDPAMTAVLELKSQAAEAPAETEHK